MCGHSSSFYAVNRILLWVFGSFFVCVFYLQTVLGYTTNYSSSELRIELNTNSFSRFGFSKKWYYYPFVSTNGVNTNFVFLKDYYTNGYPPWGRQPDNTVNLTNYDTVIRTDLITFNISFIDYSNMWAIWLPVVTDNPVWPQITNGTYFEIHTFLNIVTNTADSNPIKIPYAVYYWYFDGAQGYINTSFWQGHGQSGPPNGVRVDYTLNCNPTTTNIDLRPWYLSAEIWGQPEIPPNYNFTVYTNWKGNFKLYYESGDLFIWGLYRVRNQNAFPLSGGIKQLQQSWPVLRGGGGG